METPIALTDRQQKFVKISAFTSKGAWVELEKEMNAALDSGLAVNEIKEILVYLYAYCGFGRSIHGTNTLIGVVKDREAKGIKDKQGREATPVTDKKSKYERGEKVQQIITGMNAEQLKNGFAVFSPRIDLFLKEHLFTDIFGSDVHTYAERETVTISSLFTTEEPFAQGHVNSGFNVGLTEAQLRSIVKLIEINIGEKHGQFAREILDRVIGFRSISYPAIN
ncbi:carboxymuconolactone decarboxylase [Rhodocytophaga rosea]|uniref:Carboxymuconolactone decarboxylase n=1 Tax=Rhodocytophaga rosea TaxID=2704465 RepID=A0A6C0GH48_9BACT|nr:carboxymuconolactone decarboxylase [Rhodocytophaga rosea]QHT67318.1 carboxymuconolactone decarboxylase [Rhodocytophaga rosea]